MQISATTSIQAIAPSDRQAANAQSQAKAYNATAALKQAEQNVVTPRVFTPARRRCDRMSRMWSISTGP